MTIPKNEKIWVTHKDSEGNVKYIVTSKVDDRTLYFLHSFDGEKLMKVAKNKNPLAFHKIIEENSKITNSKGMKTI